MQVKLDSGSNSTEVEKRVPARNTRKSPPFQSASPVNRKPAAPAEGAPNSLSKKATSANIVRASTQNAQGKSSGAEDANGKRQFQQTENYIQEYIRVQEKVSGFSEKYKKVAGNKNLVQKGIDQVRGMVFGHRDDQWKNIEETLKALHTPAPEVPIKTRLARLHALERRFDAEAKRVFAAQQSNQSIGESAVEAARGATVGLAALGAGAFFRSGQAAAGAAAVAGSAWDLASTGLTKIDEQFHDTKPGEVEDLRAGGKSLAAKHQEPVRSVGALVAKAITNKTVTAQDVGQATIGSAADGLVGAVTHVGTGLVGGAIKDFGGALAPVAAATAKSTGLQFAASNAGSTAKTLADSRLRLNDKLKVVAEQTVESAKNLPADFLTSLAGFKISNGIRFGGKLTNTLAQGGINATFNASAAYTQAKITGKNSTETKSAVINSAIGSAIDTSSGLTARDPLQARTVQSLANYGKGKIELAANALVEHSAQPVMNSPLINNNPLVRTALDKTAGFLGKRQSTQYEILGAADAPYRQDPYGPKTLTDQEVRLIFANAELCRFTPIIFGDMQSTLLARERLGDASSHARFVPVDDRDSEMLGTENLLRSRGQEVIERSIGFAGPLENTHSAYLIRAYRDFVTGRVHMLRFDPAFEVPIRASDQALLDRLTPEGLPKTPMEKFVDEVPVSVLSLEDTDHKQYKNAIHTIKLLVDTGRLDKSRFVPASFLAHYLRGNGETIALSPETVERIDFFDIRSNEMWPKQLRADILKGRLVNAINEKLNGQSLKAGPIEGFKDAVWDARDEWFPAIGGYRQRLVYSGQILSEGTDAFRFRGKASVGIQDRYNWRSNYFDGYEPGFQPRRTMPSVFTRAFPHELQVLFSADEFRSEVPAFSHHETFAWLGMLGQGKPFHTVGFSPAYDLDFVLPSTLFPR